MRKACASYYKVLAMIDHFARSHELECACTEKKWLSKKRWVSQQVHGFILDMIHVHLNVMN